MPASKGLNRRDFMKLCGAFSLAAAAPVGIVPIAEASSNGLTRMQLKMGTTVSFTVISDSKARAEDAIAAAFAEMDRLIAIFDRHTSGTAVFELNRTGRLSDPGMEMLEVIEQAAQVYNFSQGAFDPTILPALTLIEKSFSENKRPPHKSDIEQAMKLVDFKGVRFGAGGVRLAHTGQKISLDGVAKGYIVDRAGAKLREMGVKSALINAGGDILTIGNKAEGKPWRVGIQNPFKRNSYIKIINLTDQAVATSGSYEIYYDKKREFHHLLNPVTGLPATRMVSATTICSSTGRADALSTAAFIQPKTFDRIQKAEGMLVTREGRTSATPGFSNLQAG